MKSNYEILSNYVIHQKEIVNKLQTYDNNYVDERYNSYGEKGMQMAYLRYGFLRGVLKQNIDSILDIGYGNGDFLRVCKDTISHCFGNDVSNYPLPTRCNFIDDIFSRSFDVVCFFDSLEHFEDISFVKRLKTSYIYISVPLCPTDNIDDEFMNWKHRREDEHLYHFTKDSLAFFMYENGFKLVKYSDVEDTIRIPSTSKQNILSGIFEKY